MSAEQPASSPLVPDDPPESIDASDLLQDLRDLIVTDETESMRSLASLLSSLQAKIEDRRGLITLLKPVIATVLSERFKENPAELRELLRPVVEEILWEGTGTAARGDTGTKAKVREALRVVKDRARSMFSREQHAPPVVNEPPVEGPPPEVCDADFALFELFFLGRPSLGMLAHGSWQDTRVQAQAEEQLLPLIRRFVTTKAGNRDIAEPLQARFGRFHVHIEPGKLAYLAVLYEGAPAVGFLLDVRQTLADLHAKYADSIRRGQAVPPYRGALRLLLDRYRPTRSRLGAHAQEDPIKWPPPASNVGSPA